MFKNILSQVCINKLSPKIPSNSTKQYHIFYYPFTKFNTHFYNELVIDPFSDIYFSIFLRPRNN